MARTQDWKHLFPVCCIPVHVLVSGLTAVLASPPVRVSKLSSHSFLRGSWEARELLEDGQRKFWREFPWPGKEEEVGLRGLGGGPS